MPDDAITRRRFVVAGAALGAAIVWTSPFPFADAAIGQTITNSSGPTGPTGPTGPSDGTGETGPSQQQPPPATGDGPHPPTNHQVLTGLEDLERVFIRRKHVTFDQHFAEGGAVSWFVELTYWSNPAHHGGPRVPHRLHVGKGSAKIAKAGKRHVELAFGETGQRALLEHPKAQLKLFSTFVRPDGHRVRSSSVIRRAIRL